MVIVEFARVRYCRLRRTLVGLCSRTVKFTEVRDENPTRNSVCLFGSEVQNNFTCEGRFHRKPVSFSTEGVRVLGETKVLHHDRTVG